LCVKKNKNPFWIAGHWNDTEKQQQKAACAVKINPQTL